jgi:Protein of unknown function (DUF732)
MANAMKRAIAIAALAVASVVQVPTAHADDEQGYLDELAQSGVPMGGSPGSQLRGGREVCDDLHHGMSPDQIINTQFGVFGGVMGAPIVHAAQHHLCPDTLPPGG